MSVYSPISGHANGDLRQMLETALARSRRRDDRPIPFIEEKAPDFREFAEILQLSSESGYWTNFGPVCALLESTLGRYLNLPPQRTVVMCSSGTSALLTLIALKGYCAGRRLRWVISAYGFRSTQIGLLADAMVLDCDDRAMLDIEALAALDPATWDGVVLTNVFGLSPDARDYAELCRQLGKELVIDNAALLRGFTRDKPDGGGDEILSFHQTKPWGMGEGGCAIVSRNSAPLFRELMNPGVDLSPTARVGASNSKISDFSCALILQRLLQAAEWCGSYQAQACRILRIALEAGLCPLAPLNVLAPSPPHLPMLAPHRISEEGLANETLVLHKYYKPLSKSARNAWAIYDRIVNIPCHPGVAALGDQEILHCLASL